MRISDWSSDVCSSDLGNIASARAQMRGLPVLSCNAWGMAYGALAMIALALVGGAPFAFDTALPYVASLLYLALCGSVIAFGAYLTLLGRIGADRAAYADRKSTRLNSSH